jgi:hypothetical protein
VVPAVWLAAGIVLGAVLWRQRSFAVGLYFPWRALYLASLWGWLSAYRIRARVSAWWGWRTLKAAAFGLDGAPVSRAAVVQEPTWLRSGRDYAYEELSNDLLPDAHATRNRHAADLWRTLQETLEHPNWTIDALVQPLLRGQLGLLHGAYFRNAPLIEKIAAWFALTEEQREAVARRRADEENEETERMNESARAADGTRSTPADQRDAPADANDEGEGQDGRSQSESDTGARLTPPDAGSTAGASAPPLPVDTE